MTRSRGGVLFAGDLPAAETAVDAARTSGVEFGGCYQATVVMHTLCVLE